MAFLDAVAGVQGYVANSWIGGCEEAQEESRQEAQEFKAEIEILSQVHYGNLVNLFRFCYEHGEQMLVYEFCMNGNLQEWIVCKFVIAHLTAQISSLFFLRKKKWDVSKL